jgi:hypothetical protein
MVLIAGKLTLFTEDEVKSISTKEVSSLKQAYKILSAAHVSNPKGHIYVSKVERPKSNSSVPNARTGPGLYHAHTPDPWLNNYGIGIDHYDFFSEVYINTYTFENIHCEACYWGPGEVVYSDPGCTINCFYCHGCEVNYGTTRWLTIYAKAIPTRNGATYTTGFKTAITARVTTDWGAFLSPSIIENNPGRETLLGIFSGSAPLSSQGAIDGRINFANEAIPSGPSMSIQMNF